MANPALVAALVLAVVVAGWAGLYLDGRRQRKALRATEERIEVLTQRVNGQTRDMATMSRTIAAVARGDAGNVKLTAALPRPEASALVRPEPLTGPPSKRTAADIADAPRPEPDADVAGDRGGLNPPTAATPAAVAAAIEDFEVERAKERAATAAEVARRLAAADAADAADAEKARLDTERKEPPPQSAEESPPETPPPSTAPTSSRPREARTRPTLPDARPEDFDDEDELTRAFTKPLPLPPPPRPSLLRPLSARPPHPLAGVPVEQPTSSAARTAAAFFAAHPEAKPLETTMISAGTVPPGTAERLEALAAQGRTVEDVVATGLEVEEERGARVGAGSSPRPAITASALAEDRGTPSPPDPRRTPLDPRVARRFVEKVAEAQAKGQPARHCYGAGGSRCSGDLECPCSCSECTALARLLAAAAQDIIREDARR